MTNQKDKINMKVKRTRSNVKHQEQHKDSKIKSNMKVKRIRSTQRPYMKSNMKAQGPRQLESHEDKNTNVMMTKSSMK